MNTICLLKESAAWSLRNVLLFIWKVIPRVILNLFASMAIVGVIVGIKVGIVWLIAPHLLSTQTAQHPLITAALVIGAIIAALYIGMSASIAVYKTALDLYDNKPSAWFYVTWLRTMLKLAGLVICIVPLALAPLMGFAALVFWHQRFTGMGLVIPIWLYLAIVLAFALLVVCYSALMRLQFATLSIVDKTTGVWAALRESWRTTYCIRWFLMVLALIAVLAVAYQASTGAQQMFTAFSGTPTPPPPFTILRAIYSLAMLLFGFWMNLFITTLYRKISACCGRTPSSSCSCK